MTLYEGYVIHAQACPFWTEHFENRILNKLPAEAQSYINKWKDKITFGGFSLTMKLEDIWGNEKHVECYVYGHGFITEGKITFLEVIQPSYDSLERHEISLSDEVSRIKLDLEGVSEKRLPNGEIRNIPNTSIPLFRCRYSRIIETWLESEKQGWDAVQTTHTEPAPAAKQKYAYAPLAC